MSLQAVVKSRALSLSAALCLFACALAHAQQQSSNPARERDDDVIRITSELVQTDVAVFDKRGRFVEDLKPEQFELQVDGRVQPVIFFERVTAGSRSEESQLAAAARGRGAVRPPESNAAAPAEAEQPERGRLIFFFLDDMHMSGASLARARESLQRYVETGLGPYDQAAVVSASGQVGFLQQLTDNRVVLRAAVKRLGYRQSPASFNGKMSLSEYEASQVLDSGNRELYAYLLESTKLEQQMGPGSRHGDHRLAASYSAAPDLRNRLRQARAQGVMATDATLDALRSLMLSASGLPGRKLVFFLSDGFILNERNGGALETLRAVAQEAARAGAVVYTMDLRANTSSGIRSSVDASTNDYIDLSARRVGVALGELTATREPLQIIADQTGGRAVYNSDSLDEVVRQAVRETADYYLLAWRPDAAEQHKTGARLKVSVKGHPEWRVRLRAASFGTPAAAPKQPAGAAESKQPNAGVKGSKAAEAKTAEAKAAEAKSNDIELLTALGSLYPRRELPVALSVGYMDAGEQGTLLNISMQLGRADFEFDASDPSGQKAKALVDVAGAAIDDRGQFGSFKQLLTLTPDPSAPEASRPVIWHQRLKLKPGLYQVRVALRDRATGRVGGAAQWVEIPDLSKGDFALSSIFLGERGRESAPVGDDAGKPRPVVVDVDHRFARASVMRFQTYVYNAAPAAGGRGRDVQVQAQVLRGETPLVATQPLNVPVTSDPARLPFWSELSLDKLPPGRYVLQVTATDRTTDRTAVERVNFYVE
ncbi:MAG TPA: VWA domain-containing protein [Pyrinomonadaceae bacterium]|nr:VWA domain-containing protein [Pyrinomonadaceae bacterium]